MFSSILSLLANLLGFAKDRQELINSPEMQANKKAETREDIREDATNTVQNNDLDQIRKDVA